MPFAVISGQAADETDETLFLTFRSEELRRMCPGGVEKCHCAHSPGTYIDGPFDYATDPIGTVLTYGGCNPDFCTCKGSTEEFDARPAEMQKVQGLCERDEINRCLCHDKEVAEFPFDLRTFYFDCRPTKVRTQEFTRRISRDMFRKDIVFSHATLMSSYKKLFLPVQPVLQTTLSIFNRIFDSKTTKME